MMDGGEPGRRGYMGGVRLMVVGGSVGGGFVG